MYPTLTDLLRDLFGINLPLPIQMFGFMMFFAFMAAYWAFDAELRRKEREGLIGYTQVTRTIGNPPLITDVLGNAVLGFVLGFKIPYLVAHYQAFVDDPPGLLFSTQGSLWIGLLGAVAVAFFLYKEKKKMQKEVPEVIKEEVLPHELMANVTMIAFISGMIGAKIFDNLENWDRFIEDPWGNLFSASGLTFYGGLIFGAIAVLWYMNKHGVKPRIMLDVGAPGMMLSYAVGRIGCHLAGDGDWGIPNTNPRPAGFDWLPDWLWAYHYPHNVNGEGVPIPGCIGKHCSQLPLPVFPTPLYEVITCLVLFLILWGLRKRIKIPGVLFCIYLIFNGVERFLVELIRVNTRYHVFGLSFTQAELISSLLMVTGLVGWWVLKKKNLKEQPLVTR